MSLSTFIGCGLITVNTDRDMAQIIAKVQISDAVDADKIEKRELVSAYLSYGYMYVSYYGYTESAAYQLIFDNLIQNRIIIQTARLSLANDYTNKPDDKNNEFMNYFYDNALAKESGSQISAKENNLESLEKYLTPYEKAQAYYNVRVSVNSLIDSYVEAEEEDEKEDETFTARAVPTVEESEAEHEYELKEETPTEYDYEKAAVVLGSLESAKAHTNLYDLNKAVYDAYEIDLSTPERLKAFKKAIADLKKAGVINSEENVANIKDNQSAELIFGNDQVKGYTYFKDNILAQYESLIVAKYENSLISVYEDKLNNQMVYDQYVEEYNAQAINYKNNVSAYETALSEVTEDTFVLCNPYEGYGYVLNLLIGFSDEQTAALTAKKAEAGVTQTDINNYRAELLTKLVAKDQRTTWAQSSYGNYDGKNFTFDSDYIVSESSKALLGNYLGTIIGANSSVEEDDNKVEQTKWTFENIIPTSIGIEDFIDDYVNELLGTEIDLSTNTLTGTIADWNEDKRDIFEDLLYAFSTDPGSLGTYMGYVYSPKTSATTYVKEFADAAKSVVGKGVGAYELVATDYGYHLILCTKVVDQESSIKYADLTAFEADVETEGTLAFNYKKAKSDVIVSAEVGKVADRLVNQEKNREGVVTKYPNTYSDLITEETSAE